MGRRARTLDPAGSFVAYLGAELRAYRTSARLTQQQLGAQVGYVGQVIGQVELGQQMPARKLCENLDQKFQTNGSFFRMWKILAREGNVAWFRDYVTRELKAIKIRSFEVQLIPGLLQSEAYARAVIGGGRLSKDLDRLVAARMSRQAILTGDEPPRVWFVIDEAALHRPVGGREVMRDQLDRLIKVFELPNVELRIMPFSTVNYAALDGAFTVLDFADEPTLVYYEALGRPRWIEAEDEVAACEVRWDLTIADACPRDESLRILRAMRECMGALRVPRPAIGGRAATAAAAVASASKWPSSAADG